MMDFRALLLYAANSLGKKKSIYFEYLLFFSWGEEANPSFQTINDCF